MNLIVLGETLMSVADAANAFKESYDVIKINTDSNADRVLPHFKSKGGVSAHEQYDQLEFDFNIKQQDSVIFIPIHENVAGVSLSLLYQATQQGGVTVVLVRPDLGFCSTEQKMQSRVTWNVVQEYARSGKFEDLFLIDLVACEEMLPPYTIKTKDKVIGQLLMNFVHNYFYCKNSNAIVDKSIEHLETCKISTFGTVRKNNEVKFTFNTKTVERLATVQGQWTEAVFPAEANFYWFINMERLENDVDIYKDINSILKQQTDYENLGFLIFETETEDFNFIVKKTSKVQDL